MTRHSTVAGHVVRERRGRGGGNRTHVKGFGNLRPTIERRPYGNDGIIQDDKKKGRSMNRSCENTWKV